MHRAPTEDEVEINIFGPGSGECCLIHIGGGQWIVLDSCVDTESGRPVALAHLERVGVDPAQSVKLIVASHWHDDHIRGLSSVLRSCVAAKFFDVGRVVTGLACPVTAWTPFWRMFARLIGALGFERMVQAKGRRLARFSLDFCDRDTLDPGVLDCPEQESWTAF
jgi:glyoxylase-like metal-dependent hydrolase (beta-lactamase superfamily II)